MSKKVFVLSFLFCVAAVFVLSTGTFAQAPAKLNINQATEGQLRKVPGVSSEMAGVIVAQRAKTGAFKTADDLMKVPGMTKETADALVPAVAFGPAKAEAEEEEVKLPRY
jgi:competence ComEA-like helix-hairpin-helix protein